MSANFKCRLCPQCDGTGCLGELPGMGGVFEGKNFSLNVQGWKKILPAIPQEKLQEAAASFNAQKLRLAPITGAQENVGWPDEESFYAPFYAFADSLGIKLGVGDGCPDNKLQSGIAAVKKLWQAQEAAASQSGANQNFSQTKKAAVFLKPYPQEKLFERAEWALPVAEYIG
ncbi:MAG: FMN-dependent dehydrogenase, partial [Treponema sp.]|nr:FMN-dependent dehydrogenase [Treponema sp.]